LRAVDLNEETRASHGPGEQEMNLRHVCAAAGIAAFMVAGSGNAAVHRVFPGDASVIQAAIDKAKPGDTILVEPGTYKFVPGPQQAGKYYYGLRIKTNNLRLIGKEIPGQGEAGKVRLVYGLAVDPANNVRAADVGAGVYAAPDVSLAGQARSCDPDVSDDSALGQLCKANKVKGFYIRGFSVEGFPRNGIQTRWVDGFEFVRNASVNNLNNGVYPTLSLNGLVQDNVSYGSLDTAMWVAGSENVRVIGNEVFGSVIGFEITVSNNVRFMQNKVYGNTVGIGLFHPNGAGNPPTAVSALNNWVIEHNDVRDNNRPNEAVPGTFQSALPPGIGILVAGVSGHTIAKNTVEGNDYVGIAMLGWCTANSSSPPDAKPNDPGYNPNNCQARPPVINGVLYDPSVSNNVVLLNKVSGNGTNPPPLPDQLLALAADITYFEFEGSSGNCFDKNKPSNFTYVSSDGTLPTDGCKKP
jgi:parallel beta-helix repeat protein